MWASLNADDSASLVPASGEIENTLSKELEMVSQWLIDNKLSVHLGQTESSVWKNSALKVVLVLK